MKSGAVDRWRSRLRMKLRGIGDRFFDLHASRIYSQEGEELILQKFFAGKERGFYVDVGAHHPCRFSNTHAFYKAGWRGINIEPNPDVMDLFRVKRRRDINLNCGVGRNAGTLTYYRFDDAALNTFDPGMVESRLQNTPYKLLDTLDIRVERLDAILRTNAPGDACIDFLSIDVEGLDLDVLESNDWQAYRPRCVLVESLGASVEEALEGDIGLFMRGQGYVLLAKTFNTLVFVDSHDQTTNAAALGGRCG